MSKDTQWKDRVSCFIYHRTAEIGYYLAEEYWGKGIMTEAVRLLCKEVFTKTDIIRIYAEPFAYNTGSRRVLEKVTSDFTDIATATTVRKCLGRQVEEKNIRRILDGVYEKPTYSKLLKECIPANPERVAYAIARSFRWTIAPCGDIALNKLGLSTQVPVVWSYISDGPYRKFSWDNITLSFKHRTNREISFMSETTTLVVEALKTWGKDRVDDGIILSLRNRLPKKEKKKMLEETTGVSEWIYTVIRKVCAE